MVARGDCARKKKSAKGVDENVRFAYNNVTKDDYECVCSFAINASLRTFE